MSGDAINRGTDRGTLRTFIAIDLPTPVLRAFATIQAQLQSYLRAQKLDAALRWSPNKNLHLTLRFLGDTTPNQREQVTARLQQVMTQATPFRLHVDVSGQGVSGGALGVFPNLRQPRVLWWGVGGELEQLRALQAQVEEIAQAAGFAPEEKAYTPHLTLARAAREADRRTLHEVGQAIGNYVQLAATPATLNFQVNRVVYYQSELGAGGSSYTVLAELPFSGV